MKIGRQVAGRPLRIRAADYNGLLDSSERLRILRAAGDAGTERNDGCVWVKNNDASGRKFGEVLKLGDSITEAASTGFVDSIHIAGTDTTAAGESFAVMQSACGSGETQRGMVIGVCQALLNVTNAAHGYADTAASSTTLVSAAAGPVKVLWKASGTGAGKLAIVQMGGGGDSAIRVVTLAKSSGSDGAAPSTAVSYKYNVTDAITGATLLSDTAPEGNRWKSSNVAEAAIGIAWQVSGAWKFRPLDEIPTPTCEAEPAA